MVYFNKYIFFLICLVPALLVTGPFLSDFAVSIIAIIIAASIMINKNYFIFKNKYFVIFIVFNLFLITRSFFSYDPIFSLKVTLFYFRFALFSIGIAYCFYLLNPKSINKFYYCLIITFIIVVLDGYFQFIFGYNSLGITRFHEYRLSGFFGPELILGSYVSKMFPMVMVSFLILNENKKYFFLKISLLILTSVLLVLLSGERAAFFSIVLFCIIFLTLTDLIKFKLKIFILFAIIISLITVITFDEKTKTRFLDQTIYAFYGGKNYTTQEQKDAALENAKSNNKLVIFTHDTHSHYMSAYKMFIDNKFFGKGVKMFRKLCSKKEFEPYKNIRNLYRINYFENTNLEKVYNQYDAIIFPSLIESLGLPIIEATKMKMPIIVSNLPYSREISSSYIKYFNPKSVKSLYKTIYNLFLS